MLAVHDVLPAKSRLTFYFQTPYTSFLSVRDVMTLGERVNVPEAQLKIYSLIAAVTGLEDDFPADAQVFCAPEYNLSANGNFIELPILLSGYLYYFGIGLDATLPDILYAGTTLRAGRPQPGSRHHELDGEARPGRVLPALLVLAGKSFSASSSPGWEGYVDVR